MARIGMILRTVVRDCLYLNWALPAAVLPALPGGLRLDTIEDSGETWVFASLVLFRQDRLQLEALSFPRVSYPQCNFRLYVRDEDGQPSVYFLRMFVPAWVAPGARWIGGQPATAALLRFPFRAPDLGSEPWVWRVAAGAALKVSVRPGAQAPGPGPRLGDWERTVEFFRERPRGYASLGGRLRRVETSHPSVERLPVRVEVGETGLLSSTLPEVPEASWRTPHSAFFCPRIPFVFELGVAPRARAVPRSLPAPG